jgi:IclR family acetate operon transcriptional repressor
VHALPIGGAQHEETAAYQRSRVATQNLRIIHFVNNVLMLNEVCSDSTADWPRGESMSGALEKSLSILEHLVGHPEGASLAKIATDLNLLRSGCHRTLHELIRYGYVRQMPQRGDYALTTKLASMGLSFLSKSGVVDITQPLIDRLAHTTEELVRLAIVDGERLTLVAKAQGAKSGLLYDPDMGIELRLSCSAAGHAWLMTLSEEKAIQAVSRQGIGSPEHYGPNAPSTIKALLKMLQEHRRRGFSMARDVYARGMSSMAAPVQRKGEQTTGVVVIAGPSMRLTETRMLGFGPELLNTAAEIALAGNASPLLKSANVGTWGNRSVD